MEVVNLKARTLTARQLQQALALPPGTVQALSEIAALPPGPRYPLDVLPVLALLHEVAQLRLAGVLTRGEARDVVDQASTRMDVFGAVVRGERPGDVVVLRAGWAPIEMRFLIRAADAARKYLTAKK